jgi:folate-binding protein YgfZ
MAGAAEINPLRALHEQAEAEFQAYGDVEIVCTFGEPQAEYAAIRKGCAIVDAAQRGVLRVTGPDRIDFLNRFLTNRLADKDGKNPLPAGSGVYAFLLNNKGRIAADMNVLERGDCTLLETDLRNVGSLRQTLEKFVFSEKVGFEELVGKKHEIALHGPGSAEVLRGLGVDAGELKILESKVVKIDGIDALVWRDDPCGTPGYFLVVESGDAGRVWMGLLGAHGVPPSPLLSTDRDFASLSLKSPEVLGEGERVPGKRAGRPAGWAVFNTTRIEAGRAMFGIDFDDSVLPAETGQLDRAVSFTKGCYLGQEIVARMHARGQVARQIVGIRMKDDALPIAGAAIMDQQKNQVGGVTSSTISPVLSNTAICLGLVKSAVSAVGTEVLVAAEGAFRTATVAELPFISQGK